MGKKIKIGVVGLGGRGLTWIGARRIHQEMEVVAGTDISPTSVQTARQMYPDLVFYNTLDQLLEHDLEAVIIVSPAFMHAQGAIAALKAGKHVMSDVTACWTMAEAVALYEAAEQSKAVYLFAENYCYFYFIQEMKRLYGEGAIGELYFADCHYAAPYREMWRPWTKHRNEWRNWMPQTYYTSHVVGPLLFATGLRPVEVTGFATPNSEPSRSIGKRSDEVASFTIKLSNGAVATMMSNFMSTQGEHLWWHLCGAHGEMENDRHFHLAGSEADGPVDRFSEFNGLHLLNRDGHKHYVAQPPHSAELARECGHDGGDFYCIYDFIRAIRGEIPSPIDALMGIEMSVPGILAHRSALAGNVKLSIPDLTDPAVRDQYRHDTASPFPREGNPHAVPPSILGVPALDESIYAEAGLSDSDQTVKEKLFYYGLKL